MSDLIFHGEQFEKIVDIIESAKERAYRKVNEELILMYRDIGEYISLQSENAEYGDAFVQKLADFFAKNYPELKGYNRRGLYRMIQFYELYKDNEKVSPLVTQLTWTHYVILISLKDYNKINYYINQITLRNLSKRELENIIKSKEYERLDESTKLKLITKEENKVSDFIKNPILIKNSYNYTEISEKILQKLILEDISSFLDELGTGFTFIKNEYKIKIGNSYNYIDLLLFNYEYNCFIVVELKVTELRKEYIGQIEVYMNYIDNNLKKVTQDKTIGIIICKKDNHFIMEYCSDDRLISREYSLL